MHGVRGTTRYEIRQWKGILRRNLVAGGGFRRFSGRIKTIENGESEVEE
jgi:hypothetical protein